MKLGRRGAGMEVLLWRLSKCLPALANISPSANESVMTTIRRGRHTGLPDSYMVCCGSSSSAHSDSSFGATVATTRLRSAGVNPNRDSMALSWVLQQNCAESLSGHP